MKYMAISILFQQQQLFTNQLVITVVLQWLWPTGFGHSNKLEIAIWWWGDSALYPWIV